MSPTTGYAAAIDTGDLIMSYSPEAQWGVKPTAVFQQIRLDAEGFSSTKTRTRPNEINPTAQASAALTTKISSPGSINFSLSAGTFNDLIASSINGAFSAAVNMSANTIACTANNTLTDSANGFVSAGIVVGQWIKVAGFTGAGATANAGFFQVQTVAAGSITVLPATMIADAAGETVTIKGQMVRNGTTFQSFFFQKQLASDKFLQYPGAWPTGGTLTANVGDYAKGTLTFLNKNEQSATTEAGTGAPTAAPTGNVIDTVSGVGNVLRNGAAVAAVVQKIDLKWTKQGAREQYGIGSSSAQGMGKGKLEVSGSFDTYFKDFTMYQEFTSETGGPISFQALDNTGKGYIITICNATIMDPKITASGPNQDFMASFSLEGNPDVSSPSIYGGKTIQIDYFA